jgi:putative hydroxymethylpyrimidine transport system substrate-binding protein
MRRFAPLLLIGLLLGVLALSCARPPEERLTRVSLALDWFPWSNHAGFFIAQEKGYFREEGLKVDIYTPADPATVLQTVGAGKDDFGISYQVEVLLARQEGVPVVSIMGLVQHPLNSVMALKESGIDRPGKLKGKKVGYPGIAYNEPMLETMLRSDGASLEDVELINVGYDLVPALIGKKVDAIVGAYWVHESISAELQGHPVNIMRMEQWGVPDFYELVLVTSEKMLVQRPDVVRRFVRAAIRGYQEAMEDPQRAIDILAQAHPEIDERIERRGVELLAPLWRDDIPAFGWQEEERWAGFAEWMEANGILRRGVDPRRAFTNRFVEEATGKR